MKLSTKIIEGELTYTPKGVYHDAMVAHALVMALPDGSLKESVLRHADELMREWGLGED